MAFTPRKQVPVVAKEEVKEAPVVVIEQAEDAKEVATTPRGFLSISLKRFHRKDGRVVNPDVDGYFVPKDQEDLDILMDHMQQGRVVFK